MRRFGWCIHLKSVTRSGLMSCRSTLGLVSYLCHK
ncbi:unnamed protein product, partial [Vitis vinifera]|uniref:Uncharacterized protein n=1 Tax=Vitis vinifera TaxID=29760 RepID=D7U361_VITVI